MKRILSVWILAMAWFLLAWSLAWPLSAGLAHGDFWHTLKEYLDIGFFAVGLALISYHLARHFLGRGISEGSFLSICALGIGLTMIASSVLPPYDWGTVTSGLVGVAMIWQFVHIRKIVATSKLSCANGT